MKRRILVAVLGLIIIAGLLGVYLYTKQTPDVVAQTPDVTVTAEALIKAFETDTASASQKYIDKVVEVTGHVKRIDSASAIVLGEAGSSSEVIAGLDRRHLDDYKKNSGRISCDHSRYR